MHSSDSLRVRGYEFPSNSFNVDQHFQVQISPMRLPSKSEGPKCLKYQNVPYKRNFWHIVKPWERFQRWVRLIYFLTVPDDHTVVPTQKYGQLIIKSLSYTSMVCAIGGLQKSGKFTCSGDTFQGCWLLLILMMFQYKSMVSSSYNHCCIHQLSLLYGGLRKCCKFTCSGDTFWQL